MHNLCCTLVNDETSLRAYDVIKIRNTYAHLPCFQVSNDDMEDYLYCLGELKQNLNDKMVSPEDINNMHRIWIKTLEEKDCTAFQLVMFATDVSALSLEMELLPLLKYFDKLIMTLRMKFRTDLKHLLQTANESDHLDLLYCYEDVENNCEGEKP